MVQRSAASTFLSIQDMSLERCIRTTRRNATWRSFFISFFFHASHRTLELCGPHRLAIPCGIHDSIASRLLPVLLMIFHDVRLTDFILFDLQAFYHRKLRRPTILRRQPCSPMQHNSTVLLWHHRLVNPVLLHYSPTRYDFLPETHSSEYQLIKI